MSQLTPGPGDWPRLGHDLHNTRFNEQETTIDAGNVGRLKLKWRTEIGAPTQTTPCVVGNTIYVGAWDGHYYSLEADSGQIRWGYLANSKPSPHLGQSSWGYRDMRSSAQYAGGRIYFGTGKGEVHCVDAATGQGVWKTQVGADPATMVSASPTVFGERVFVGTSGDRSQIACLDTETGSVRWRFYILPDRTNGGGSVWSSAAVDEEQGIVFNVTGNPRAFKPPGPLLYSDSIIANDLETGELLWHYQARATDPFDLDFSCHPMIFEAASPGQKGARRQCVGAGSKTAFHTCDRYTGELLWKVMLTPGSIQGGPWMDSTAAAYNRVYLVSNAINNLDSESGRVAGLGESVTAALHAYTGEIVWWHYNRSMNRAPVCVANGVFYQSLYNKSLEAYDAHTGRQLWQSSLPSTSRGGIVIANGALYASNGEGGGFAPEREYSVYAYTIDGR
jgi:polyvinyl alcohol dehydrogenase (cytochrome)